MYLFGRRCLSRCCTYDANLRTERCLLVEVAPPELTVFSCADDALSLYSYATWPTHYLASHVMIVVTRRHVQSRVAKLVTEANITFAYKLAYHVKSQ